MNRLAAWFVLLFLVLCADLPGQQRTPPEARYYRLICLVHMTGSGKHNDPLRPEYVPTVADASRAGILAWSMQLTDDKSMAILHVVAANKKAVDSIMNNKRADVRVFEIGTHGKDTIEAELRKVKKNFSLDTFQVVAQ